MASSAEFNYEEAFSRNIGWFTEREQQSLRNKRVVIGGSGGVGGAHLLTLARMGVGRFTISDFDSFEVANMNRQAGAFMSTVGCQKADVMARMARDINPEAELTVLGNGVSEENVDEFLDGADLFVDGFDFFAMAIRRRVFQRCAELGIPALTAAPIGMGAAYLVFLPGRMTFEEYFRLEGLADEQQYLNFFIGLTPKALHRAYLVDPTRLDLTTKRGPSTAAGIQLCSGVVGAEAAKILLKRGPVYAAPWYHHFDAYRVQWKRGYLPMGNANPVQRLKRFLGRGAFKRMAVNAWPRDEEEFSSDIERILDIARWAPSGDNSQPWTFEIQGEDKVVIHVSIDGTERNVYDFNDGQPTLISAGMLLETIRIAASWHGKSVQWRIAGKDRNGRRIEVSLTDDPSVQPDELLHHVRTRSVDRRSYSPSPLGQDMKDTLATTLGDGHSIRWFEGDEAKRSIARINGMATDIRLRIPEAYRVHQKIVDWRACYSRTGIPASAIGMSPMTLRIMRWSLKDWKRAALMNRLPSGTAVAQRELDKLPGQNCAAHFAISLAGDPAGSDDDREEAFIRTGEAIQRFWLTADRLGLVMQPSLAPLCFAHYARYDVAFTQDDDVLQKAKALQAEIGQVIGDGAERLVFLGRIGYPGPRPQVGRSIRKTLGELAGPESGS